MISSPELTEPRISIVCVYNNTDTLNRWLKHSILRQTIEIEQIFIDNSSSTFFSAAKALNFGAQRARGNFLMFVHQDIRFCTDSFLEDCLSSINKLNKPGCIGVAGRSGKFRWVVSNLVHGDPPFTIGEFVMEKPEKVQTVDECLIVVPRNVFNSVKFDEVTCDGWHLYGVDLCLSLESKGYVNYVIPWRIHHISAGSSMSYDYFKTLKKVMAKHRNNYDVIYTTLSNYYCKIPLVPQIIRFYIFGVFYKIWRGIKTHRNLNR